MTNNRLQTKFVQLGNKSDEKTGAINPPIYLSTAYQHKGLGQSTGYDYTRTKNPTRTILEEGIADLETGDSGFACSSGMAAIQLVLSLFRSGDHILAPEDLYGGTYRIFEQYAETYQIETTYDTFETVEKTEQLINERTKALFIETPTNPLMQEIDILSYATLAQKHKLLLIVDNTFLTPYLQQPLKLGADIVIHSATKYIGGHNDVLAGLVVAKGTEICEKLSQNHNATGAVLSPVDSWLLIRGLKTLALRVERHEENAKSIAKFLNEQPAVSNVFYPNKGGMLSFSLKEEQWVDPFLSSLNLIVFAESLGGVESFITYPTTQTHADIPEQERIRRGISNHLLRFSAGIEHVEDLKADLQQALSKLNEEDEK